MYNIVTVFTVKWRYVLYGIQIAIECPIFGKLGANELSIKTSVNTLSFHLPKIES